MLPAANVQGIPTSKALDRSDLYDAGIFDARPNARFHEALREALYSVIQTS